MVSVSPDDLEGVENHGTMWVATGTDAETGERVTFAGDWRPMRDLCLAVQQTGEARDAAVPDWAVLRVAAVI